MRRVSEEEGRCEVCRHPKRDAIEADLVSGVGYARLEKQYGIAEWTLGRHKRLHLRREVQAASARMGSERRRRLLAASEESLEGMRRIWAESRQKDPRLALQALKGMGHQAIWEIGVSRADDAETAEWSTDPGWARLRDGLLEVLRPHAKAHEAVTEWLRRLEEEAKKAA
ncbi:MAG: hypothetical protein ACKV22_15475 [Bryobacteraceae bacterium]